MPNDLQTRKNIYSYFIGEAQKHNNLHFPPKPEDFFDNNGRKRLLNSLNMN